MIRRDTISTGVCVELTTIARPPDVRKHKQRLAAYFDQSTGSVVAAHHRHGASENSGDRVKHRGGTTTACTTANTYLQIEHGALTVPRCYVSAGVEVNV